MHSRVLRPNRLLPAILAALLWFTPAYGQTDQGRIVGTVRDQNGAVVPGANISLKNERTGEERVTSTNEAGVYILPGLRASQYTIKVKAVNFADATVNGVHLSVGQEQTLDLSINPAGVSETIDVIAGASEAAIDTGSARLGATVDQREVVGLPLNGRQLSQLYLQAPGSVNSGSGTFGDIRFSGRAVQQNIVRYDGVGFRDH